MCVHFCPYSAIGYCFQCSTLQRKILKTKKEQRTTNNKSKQKGHFYPLLALLESLQYISQKIDMLKHTLNGR